MVVLKVFFNHNRGFEVFRICAKSFVLCSEVFGAALQITKLGDHPLAADSTAVKAVFPLSHFHKLFPLKELMPFYKPHFSLSSTICQATQKQI